MAEHLHDIVVPEDMENHWYRGRYSVGSYGFNRFAEQGPNRPVGDLSYACLVGSAGSLITPLLGDFLGGDHHLQLADALVV